MADMTRIEKFGWRGAVEPGIARVVSAHGDYYHLVCNEAGGEIIARKKKSLFTRMKSVSPDNMRPAKGSFLRANADDSAETALKPMTGDFVRFRYNDRGDSLITEVLPRFSKFVRRDPAARRTEQILAVNFDALFIMTSLNEDFSIPRIARFLSLAEDLGEAKCVLLLTKADLLPEGKAAGLEKLEETVGSRAETLKISSLTGEGIESLSPYVKPGRTVAFIGSSGVGKSTLLNVLAGEEIVATQEIQEWSGKGRHTTTSRDLVMLPSGALVLDTPGIREIGRVDEEERLLAKGVSTHRWRLK